MPVGNPAAAVTAATTTLLREGLPLQAIHGVSADLHGHGLAVLVFLDFGSALCHSQRRRRASEIAPPLEQV